MSATFSLMLLAAEPTHWLDGLLDNVGKLFPEGSFFAYFFNLRALLALVLVSVSCGAVGALSAIRDAGLTPGTDVAIAGFDDIPTVRDVTPALTTVRVPLEEIGRRALRLALGDEVAQAEGAVRTEVVLRESTPPRR